MKNRALIITAMLGMLAVGLLLTTSAAGRTSLRSAPQSVRPASAQTLTATFTGSNHVSFTLSACRLPDSNHDGIPDYLLPIAGKFVCHDADYTTGNLGKSWNELDLVPHRLTTQAGSQADATTDYNVIVAADNVTGGKTGYDVIDGFAVDTALSDASCSVSAGPTTFDGTAGSPFGGGTDTVMYRILTLHQSKGTTCVFDYYQRLALGAHLYPGSSLQSYLFEDSGLSQGKKTLSIPVNQVAPQELDKDMTATRSSDHVWDLTKGATPAELAFNNTCDNNQSLSNNGVKITVTWTKHAANATGPATIITHIYATNPAARVVTLNNMTDNIYAGNDQTTLLDSASAGPVDLPANTANILILTHTFVWNNPGTSANDIATASYTDKVTGVPIPGTTTASASANVTTASELNASAVINDVESITGSGLSYSTDSFSGASGAFDGGYVAGTKTTGSVSWTSDSQGDSGSVEFDKTIYATKGAIEPSGNLHDDATLTGSDGASATASADIPITVNTIASLTIDKTIPNILQTGETATFLFHVKSTNDVNAPDVASTSITFTAGQTHKTEDVSNLAPGVYYVFEDAAPGWQPNPNGVQVDVSGNACSGTASFTNTAELAAARVKKVTNPAGFEGNWTFKLYKGANLLETATSSDGNFTNFTSTLGEGSYSIVETSQDGWQSDGGDAGCSFTVNLPADGGKTFDCTFTNTYQPTVDITKTGDTLSKIGDLAHYTIELDNTSSAGGAAGAPNLVCDISDPTIGFSKTVTLGPGDSDTSNPTFTVPAGASDPFLNTATANCHYPNLTAVVATDQSQWSTNLFQPSITVTKTGPTYSKVGDTANYSVTIKNTSSSDSPDLVFDSFSDSKAGSVSVPAACNTLAVGASCTVSYTYTVQAGDADPLVNTATAHYHPTGFTNDIHNSGQWSTDLLHPSFTLAKSCDSQPVPQGGSASFTVTLHNTGDADLVIDPDEGASNTYSVAAGGSTTFAVTKPVPAGATSVSNTVNATATLASKYGLSNVVSATPASASCNVAGLAKVHKTVSGQPPAAGQTFHFELRSGASTFSDGTILEAKDTDASGNISFTTQLTPGTTYQICEWVFPGWNTNLAGDGPLFVPNSLIPPALPNPNVINLTVCANFTVTSGQTRTFTVDNSPPPGGRAVTIGFWKNWASCSGGKQKPVLDQTLAAATGATTNPPGGLVYSAQNPGALWPNYAPTYYGVLKGKASTPNSAPDCLAATNLLNKSTIDGKKKMSSDPLFNMTAQLVGAELNRFIGAGINGTTIVNIDRAVLLNGKYKLNGLTYTPKLTTADANTANCLATQLDNYNNGRPVSLCP
jgi:hypothetical protein